MQHHANVLNIIFIYNIEAMNISAGLLAWSALFVMVFYPYTYQLSQLVVLVIWCAGAISIILNTYLPVLKIIFVVNFEFIFAQEPETLGKNLLMSSIILGCIPQSLICTYQFFKDQVVGSTAAYFMGDNLGDRKVVYLLQLYPGFLLLINLVLLGFALVYIPFYLKKNHPLAVLTETSTPEVETQHIRLGRILLGSVVAILCTIAATIISKMSVKARVVICEVEICRPSYKNIERIL
jgi:hypothetical protein